VRALAAADSLADFRDQALWAMVELERGMKEATRTALDEERARAKSRQDELYDALKQFEGRFANIHQEARGTILSLSDNILFGFDKADLKQDARYDLVRVSTILQQFPEMHIYIEGHTDNVGAEDYNQKLSEKRAQAVLRFLAEQSVSLDRMDWYGYGMSRPVASNATEDGRARNRRVDLVIAEAAGE
jgi:outer membrane protein OmpA-like peptidoglycan-associated protein